MRCTTNTRPGGGNSVLSTSSADGVLSAFTGTEANPGGLSITMTAASRYRIWIPRGKGAPRRPGGRELSADLRGGRLRMSDGRPTRYRTSSAVPRMVGHWRNHVTGGGAEKQRMRSPEVRAFSSPNPGDGSLDWN